MSEKNRQVYEFGPFRLDAQKRLLSRGESVVKLAPKVFETLLALVEGRGRVLDKAELMKRVWPDTFVEEGNLTLNISTLRKALGETLDQHRYIVTVPGQGYRFVAEVTQVFDDAFVPGRTRPEAVQEAAKAEPSKLVVLPTFRASLGRRLRSSVPPLLIGLALAGAGGSVWFYLSRNRDAGPRAGAAASMPQPLTVTRFAAHGGVPLRVAISPDGKSLVYQQRMNGRDSLWLGQTETSSSVSISQGTDLAYGEPAFAPDGRSIYFTVSPDRGSQSTLMRMPALGGVMTELIPDVHSPVCFSPDGGQLAFVRRDDEASQTSIVLAGAADGTNQRTLVTRKWPDDFSTLGVAWSPDGKTIAVGARRADGREEISAVTIANGAVTKLGARDWGATGNLAWLPDGKGVVVLARENAVTRRAYIWFLPYPDGGARKITDDLNLYLRNSLSVSAGGTLAVLQGFIHSDIWVAPKGDVKQARRVLQGVAPRYEGVDGLAWTVDGRLLYTAYTGDNVSIWSMNSDGGDLRHLTGSGADVVDSQISVTADGRYMVFQSNRSGALEIWRANTDGTGLTQLTSGGNNSLPSLSPEGRWVVYTSTRDGQSTLWRTSIDGGAATQLTDRSSSWPQISPDGTRIAYTAAAEAPDDRLTIIPFARGPAVKSFAVPKTGLTGRRVMRWTPDGRALLYKDDLRGLWRQGLDDDKPELVRGFEELLLHHLAWSADGKYLAYTAGPASQEIILMENVK